LDLIENGMLLLGAETYFNRSKKKVMLLEIVQSSLNVFGWTEDFLYPRMKIR